MSPFFINKIVKLNIIFNKKNSMAKKENFEFGSVLYTPSGIGISDIVDKKTNNKWVSWGEDNKLPYILWDNYLKNSTLSSIVNSMVDYIMGEGVECSINIPDL
jgi:hypothetical protein